MAESKESKFKRLAEARTQRCLDSIRTIGNLAGSGYVSTDDQQEAVFTALRAALDNAEARFNTAPQSRPRFSL